MADPTLGEGPDAVAFYAADPRGVMPLSSEEGLHIPRSVRKAARSGRFVLRCDTAFVKVIRACAEPRKDEPESWINNAIVHMYAALHRAGFAHSVEAWRRDPESAEERLVGGIYGVAIGAAFIGESMFHRARPRFADGSRHPFDGTDASSVCLAATIAHLRRQGFTLFDTQFTNPHIERFGCFEIALDEYLHRLRDAAYRDDVRWGAFFPAMTAI